MTGFGGNGEQDGQLIAWNGTYSITGTHCVKDGPFASIRPKYLNGDVLPHCLSRGFNNGEAAGLGFKSGHLHGYSYRPEVVQYILQRSDYVSFSRQLQDIPHNAIHTQISGDMEGESAPNG